MKLPRSPLIDFDSSFMLVLLTSISTDTMESPNANENSSIECRNATATQED